MENKSLQTKKGDIGKISSTANVEPDKASIALGRTLLIKSLNTGRCTTPQELADRFQKMFDVCVQNGFTPTVEMLALASRLG